MGYIKWLGHASFEVCLDEKILIFDPWFTGNPMASCKVEDLEKVDYVFVTHDHGDHFGDAVNVCIRTNATLVGIYEISVKAQQHGVKNTIGMNIGGPAILNDLKVVMTPAFHSSSSGCPAGFIVIGKEATVYHAGDTGLFSDIALYAELYPIDYAMIPIGGHYTMDPQQAAKFVSLFKPKRVIPMHYNTFPVIRKDPQIFVKYVREYAPEVGVVVLKPGEKLEF
ncbi:MAG: metal-dependent hydrolase [Thermoprotei archaeon]|nr:MAG: metal-dependent hydrolase [Thermoprotei archaeon]